MSAHRRKAKDLVDITLSPQTWMYSSNSIDSPERPCKRRKAHVALCLNMSVK